MDRPLVDLSSRGGATSDYPPLLSWPGLSRPPCEAVKDEAVKDSVLPLAAACSFSPLGGEGWDEGGAPRVDAGPCVSAFSESKMSHLRVCPCGTPPSPQPSPPKGGEGARCGKRQSRILHTLCDYAPAHYKLNTYSIDAVDVFFNSGMFWRMLTGWREPTSTAMYCLPFTA
jgi:hypothetical protein